VQERRRDGDEREHAGATHANELRVLIADDYEPLRLGIRAYLERHGFVVCAEAGNADAALAAAHGQRPDVCVIDPNMPGDGIAAVEQIASECPETAVIVLTVSQHGEDLLRAVRAGAAGYVLKECDPERLVRAVRAALAGDTAVPRELLERALRARDAEDSRRTATKRGSVLSGREWEVLGLMREGLSTAEIARRLFVAKVTVRSHIASIRHKLGVQDRAAAVRMFETEDGVEDLQPHAQE
jgi:two-component system, NarL family, nitrate/nitrite response regulator NarL